MEKSIKMTSQLCASPASALSTPSLTTPMTTQTNTPLEKTLVQSQVHWARRRERDAANSSATLELGDLLLAAAKLVPAPGKRRHAPRSRSWSVLALAVFCAVVSRCALARGELSPRVHDLVGGILLVASAGACYLCVCHALVLLPTRLVGHCAREVGELLLGRSNPRFWAREKRRLFLEVCSWMATVWCSYTAFRSGWLAIAAGVACAMVLAFASDFLAAYLRLLEAQLDPQTHGLEGVLWSKVVLSYGCVGYVISETGRILHGFVYEDGRPEAQSVEQLAVNYLLITLVGVSLILASELLLLCSPTRRAGLVLQSRLVDARENWEKHPLRSLAEVSGTFGATSLYYSTSQEMFPALQIGTCCGVLLILGSELLAAPNRPRFLAGQPTVEMPADHWLKLIPVAVMMLYFLSQVYAAIVLTASLSAGSLTLLLGFVGLATVILTGLALSDRRASLSELGRLGKQVAGKCCVLGITALACKFCHGAPGIVFSCLLSVFCLAFSWECWDDMETSETVSRDATAECMETTETIVLVAQDNWTVRALSFVKERYPHLYKRVKWTFLSIVVISLLDMCSTLFVVIQQDALALSLSQFSAGNVVISASVGYFTSPVPYQLHPVVLVHTGVERFKNKWVIFPLHAFVEMAIFIGVFIGTFAATSTVFSSLTLAALSGIVVSVGGHWVCSRLNLTVGNHMRVQLTATCALLFCLSLFTYACMMSLHSIYHYFDSIEAAFLLASFAGVFFLAASEMFLLWKPTREVGNILQCRVTNAKENWRVEPLRSFVELFTWFAVICGSFALYDDLLLALQLGTFSGIAVTLSGEYFRKNRTKLMPWGRKYLLSETEIQVAPLSPISALSDDDEDDLVEPRRARPLPVMLLFAYVGSGTFQWIFENIRSLEVTVLLATIAGIAFLCFADMLVLFKPTRWAGVILQDRFINVKRNWREYPVRSFVEFGCFLGVIYGSYAIYDDLIVAVQVGTLSGMLVTLIGEQVRSRARAFPLNDEDKEEEEKTQILPLPVMCLLGLVGAVAFNIIYTHLRSIEVAFVLATTSGVVFALLGDMFVIWKPTRRVGKILQERILYFKANFSTHTRRSWMEVTSLCGGWYLSYGCLWPGDLLVAVQFGTFTGILACVCGDLTMQYLAEVEQRLIKGVSSRLALDSQKDSELLNMPYEVLFEVAHFLTPEDLLVARTTCHKVNNMLKAESARFWLHASLRRTGRDSSLHRERSRAHSISHRMGSQARSLVYEAITLVLPKIFGTREPFHVLTSGNEISRALKWVYLNADWIRKQNLPPLVKDGGATSSSEHISFSPGDVAFDVFRHMPDKACLGILVTRDEDVIVQRIDVPTAIYDKIQTDPFSFVAHETLSTLEVFSNWHLAVVAFTTMTLIFIGQFSSDLLREYVFPPSFKWWGVR